jgi:hypothetical protein
MRAIHKREGGLTLSEPHETTRMFNNRRQLLLAAATEEAAVDIALDRQLPFSGQKAVITRHKKVSHLGPP